MSQNNIIQLNQGYQNDLEGERRGWEARERQLEHNISRMGLRLDETTYFFETKLREVESEKRSMQERHIAFIRKQQEASFKQMESARWLPTDEGKVMGDFDRLKRNMRSWAKTTSIKDISVLQTLGEDESKALRQDLMNVVLFENGYLPEGLAATARSPMLLLTALLAHWVYSSFFRSPFFFLCNNDRETSSDFRQERILEDIYDRVQKSNQQDAYIWRSQTLRLLMPPLQNNASDIEKQLRSTTEESISHIANRQASGFLASPACYLIEKGTKTDFTSKLKKIYSDAATLSYMLWTRRTQMRCFTLSEIKDLAFDAESPDFDPDNLVRYDDHEDHLKDKPVTVMVHPLLKVYGTDEAKNYDQARVWAQGVVWLDSRRS